MDSVETMSENNGYNLTRQWFDFAFENPEKISPNHAALYFFTIEHCNRLGWKEKFGLPTEMAKDAIGIKSYKTYIKTLADLIDWGFIKMIERSKNQYSANIVALGKNAKAHTKALDKARLKHVSKQVQSTYQSIDSIDKQYNPITNEPLNPQTDVCVDEKKVDDSDTEFSKEVLHYFGFNETANFNKLRTISDFIKKQKNVPGGFDYFKEQFHSYGSYKKISGERTHNLTSYLGTQQNQFEDGKWDEANWKQKIIDFKNGKSNSTDQRKQSVADLRSRAREILNGGEVGT